MKRLLSVAVLALASCLYLSAQIPTTITSDTDPGTIAGRIQELEDLAQQIQNGIQTLRAADEMVEYQIQALQQLSQGTWQGFVNAWDYETGALNNFAYLSSQIAPLSDAVDMATFMKTWSAATTIVHSTDNLIKNTQMREALWQQTTASAQTSNGLLSQLQAANQALGLLGGEVQDIHMALGAWKQYFVTRQEIEDTEAQQVREVIDGYYQTSYLSNTGDPYDLSQQDAALSSDSSW